LIDALLPVDLLGNFSGVSGDFVGGVYEKPRFVFASVAD
jgi:hypothetical protein